MPTAREKLFEIFEELSISTTTKEHQALHSVSESKELRGKIPGGHSKNLFLKNKDGKFWLVVALEDTEVNIKALAKKLDAKNLSFARAEYLEQKLGVTPGSVTPFALINNMEKDVTVVLDKALTETAVLNFHPLENTATTTISSADLLKFLDYTQHKLLIHDLNIKQS